MLAVRVDLYCDMRKKRGRAFESEKVVRRQRTQIDVQGQRACPGDYIDDGLKEYQCIRADDGRSEETSGA